MALSGGEITTDGGTEIVAKGFCWSDQPNPDTSDYKTFDGIGIYDFTSELSNLVPDKTYYVRAYAINNAGIGYGNELIFTAFPEVVYDSVTDIDGNIYKTVQIGNQTWMAENLRTTTYKNGITIPYALDEESWMHANSGAYCYFNSNAYGALYNWYTTSLGNLCPTGWHVPDDIEWEELSNTLGGREIAGEKLKEAGWSHWQEPNYNANNSSGFSAIPNGFRTNDGEHGQYNEEGCFLSATPYYIWVVTWLSTKFNKYDIIDGNSGASVRCLKD
jgi:uncharacterized protein (TIGR02145 family)